MALGMGVHTGLMSGYLHLPVGALGCWGFWSQEACWRPGGTEGLCWEEKNGASIPQLHSTLRAGNLELEG